MTHPHKTDRLVIVNLPHPGCIERELAMLNFYKANYPRPPYRERAYPPVKCPVLMIHGLEDMWLMPEALNGIWRYLEKDLTLLTVPQAGHWVHVGPVQAQGAPDLVTKRMVSWLTQE
jgi:pimeloyl-ACP methyl ester carboxylesterase